MKRSLWILGLSASALAGLALTGIVGLVSSARLIMAAPDPARLAAVVAAPAPRHDPARPTVALVLGDTRTEATDFLAPYAMFAESGAYNVYAVADSREPRTLAGGVDVVPQLSFAELDERVPDGPDVILTPAITGIESAENAPILAWLRQHRDGATLFSWCAGAEVLAASGLIDGRSVTTHWEDIDHLAARYPALDWRRGVRYVDEGDVVTTGGLTAGVDGTLHFLSTRNGPDVANRVADAMHYPRSMFADDPRAAQYALEPVDAAVYLNLSFNWPKPSAAVWLYDGVGEVDLAAAVEAFAVTSATAATTVAAAPSILSQHGLQIVPRRLAEEATPADRVLVPGGVGARAAAAGIPGRLAGGHEVTVLENTEAPAYAFTTALEQLAATSDVAIAEQAARHLEVRTPLELVGPRWTARILVVAVLAALAGSLGLWGAVRLGRRVRARARTRTRHGGVGERIARPSPSME
jgi:transcriptional regulator GlxA family with amidase domain